MMDSSVHRSCIREPGAPRMNTYTTRDPRLSLSDCRIIRMQELSRLLGISRSSIYDKLNPDSPRFDPTFPRRVRLGAASVGWLESEVSGWLMSRIEL